MPARSMLPENLPNVVTDGSDDQTVFDPEGRNLSCQTLLSDEGYLWGTAVNPITLLVTISVL